MILWLPQARAEFREAIDYLITEASFAIAEDFAASAQETLRLIERHPLMGTPLAGNARRLIVRNFTYSLIYRMHGDSLYIVALAHQRRRPGYWAKRRWLAMIESVPKLKDRIMPTSSLETIEATLMQLPHPDRVHLAERLLASLDEDDEILAEWTAEAERRADAMERGEVQGIPIEEALAQLRAGLSA